MHKRVVRTRQQLLNFMDTALSMVEGYPCEISIKKYSPRKTSEQNSLVHKLFRELAQRASQTDGNYWTENDMKEWMKHSYGPVVMKTFNNRDRPMPKSMADYTIEEESEMIEHCYRIAAENGWELDKAG